jgi:hypothetical protein
VLFLLFSSCYTVALLSDISAFSYITFIRALESEHNQCLHAIYEGQDLERWYAGVKVTEPRFIHTYLISELLSLITVIFCPTSDSKS